MNTYIYSGRTQRASSRCTLLFTFLLSLLTIFDVSGQNWGFEATPATTPPSNWSVVSGTWTVNTNATFVRTGTQSIRIVDPATTGTTIGTTTPFLTTTSAGFLITIGWGKSNTASNGVFYTGYRTGTTNTFNPTSTATGQPSNINNTTWSRVVSVSASGTLAANNYGIPIRAFRTASVAGTEVYLDDFIIYGSSSNVPDLTAPSSPTGVTITGNVVSWVNAIDNGAPASGIGGVVIIRTDGASVPAPALNDQAMYSTVNGAAGVGSFVNGGNTWTVVANISGGVTTNFTDISAGSGPYTYVVYMRDLAYNYSVGTAGNAASACIDPPTAGTPLAIPSTPVCASASVVLGLSGGTGGLGQTFQWESSLTSGGTFTPLSGVLTSSSFTVNPTVTTFYRCVVTCGTGTSTSSEIQVTINPAFPGGVYTINSALPTGGSNFASFTAAINAISACGIAGPIVFNVDPASGPYTEQITIPSLLGSSPTNTVTINGNGRTLQFTPVTGARHILKLDGADYITINNLNIVGLAVDFDWGIHLLNGADNDSIINCTINLSANTSTTQSNSACIVASNSTSSVIVVGNNANNLVVSGCTLIGGYSGAVLYGGGAGAQVLNNKIVNNTIRDFYSVGVELSSNNGSLIKGNDISRANRVAVTTFEGVEIGANNINVIVDGNRIHDTHNSATTQSGAAYGVFLTGADATVGSENRVINNLIYNFNSLTGTIYGLYNSSSDGAFYYHNTVVLDNSTSTAGITRGFYQLTAASNIVLQNNLIYITRAGTGAKNCLYFGATTSTIASNNNLLFMNSPGGTNGIGFYSTNQVTLADWKLANGAIYDQQSISLNPLFASPGTGDFTPTVITADDQGAPVGVTSDINNNPRSLTTPDIGAYEFTISAGVDIGAVALASPVVNDCYSNVQSVTIRIKNFGALVNFGVTPTTITCNIGGAATATLTGVPTGILAIGDSMDVVLTGTFDMSANGVYTFDAFTTCGADAINTNDAMSQVSLTRSSIVAGTVNANILSHCLSGSSTLSITGNSFGTINWQSSTGSASGPWTNLGSSLPTYNTGTLTQTTYYRVLLSCLSAFDSTNVVTIVVNNPQLTSTSPGSNCGPGNVTLSATGTGTSINWYAAPSGGLPLSTSGSFVTPLISSTTTYYAAASSGGFTVNTGLPAAASTATSGSGTTNFGIVFDALAPFTLNSVVIYPVAAAANTPGTVTIDVISGTGTVLHTATVNVLGNPAASLIGQTVPLNFVIAPGTNLKLRPGARSTSITGLLFGPSAAAPSGNYGFPFVVPGVLSLNTSTLTAAPTNTPRNDLYYYFYDWSISTGCEGPRTPVVATITTPPTISVSSLTNALCSGNSTSISVTSPNDPNFEYTWTSNPAGFTATGNGPHTVTPLTNTTYIVTALDTSSGLTAGCSAIDSVTILSVVGLTGGTVSSNQNDLCFIGTPTLTVTGSSGFIQWQESITSASGPWSNVGTGSTVYTPSAAITQTTYYRVLVNCETTFDSSNVLTVVVNNPQIVSTTGATRCGPGTLNLSATGNAGSIINWYTAATGGSPVGSGSTYTTPFITDTTTYYAEALVGNPPAVGGRLTNVAGSVLSAAPRGIIFTASNDLVIDSVGFRCSGIASTVTVQLYNAAGNATIGSPVAVNIPANAGTSTTPVLLTFPVNIQVPSAGTYRLFVTSVAPTGNVLWYEFSGVTGYPYSVGTDLSITSSVTSLTGTASLTTYYYFYKLVVSSGCVNPTRVPVDAIVTPSPDIDISGVSTICDGDSTNLSITTGLSDYTDFTWFPATGLSSTTGSSVYAKPNVTTKYYVLASGNINNCQAIDSITVNVNTFTIATSVPNPLVCANDSAQLTTSVSAGTYTYLWTPASGLSSSTISNPKVQPSGYNQLYTVVATNTVTGCSKSSSLVLSYSTPALLSTTNDTICGVGTVNLSASSSPNAEIHWYGQAVGGNRLFTGTNYSPSIISSTTYYATAQDTIPQAPISNGFTGGTTATDPNAAGNMFDVTAINNVKITGFDVHLDTISALAPSTISIYYKTGTYSGFTLNSSAWTLAGTVSGVTSAGRGLPTYVPLPLNVNIPAGATYGFYIVVTNLGSANSLVYNASGSSLAEGVVSSSDFNLQVKTGTVVFGPFTGTVAAPVNRNWNGRVYYSIGCETPRVPVEAVSLSAPAIIASTTDDTLCIGSSATLSVVSGNDPNYSYTWEPGAIAGSSINVSPTSATTYIVTGVDNTTGCVAKDTVVINTNLVPVINATVTPGLVCPGVAALLSSGAVESAPLDSLSTTATDNNGSSAVGFDITNTSTTPVVINYLKFRSNIGAGITFPVTVFYKPSSLGCVFPTNISTAPGWSNLGTVTVTSAGAAPNLSTIPLDLNITIPAGATYSFAFGSTTATSVRYVNGTSGCPTLVSDSKIAIKEGFGGTLTSSIANRGFSGRVLYSVPGGGSLTYQWTPSTHLSSATVTSPIATPPVTTLYSVTVTNNLTGCSSTDTVTLEVTPPFNPVITTNDTTLCSPNFVYVNVADTGSYSGGYPSGTQFEWLSVGGQIVPPTPDLDSIPSTFGSTYFVIVTLPNGCTAKSDTATILTKAVAIVDTITNATCTGGGSILATVTSGIAPFQYVWSTDLAQTNIIQSTVSSSNQNLLSGLSAGTYYLSVSDEFGNPGSCNSGVIAYVVTGSNPIVATVTGTDITCNGFGDGSATVNWTGGTSPFSILWSDGNTNATRAVSSASTLTVIVSDLSGCADTASVTINEPSAISLSLSSTNESAPGANDGTASVIITGGTPGYVIEWFDAGFTSLGFGTPIDSLTGGVYTCLVTDTNGCQGFDNVTVITNTNVTVNLTMLIEGMYDGAGGLVPALLNSGVGVSSTECDTIIVEIRDQVSPTTILATGTAVLGTNGQASFTFPASISGATGYIAVFHRNAVQTWSDLVTFSPTTNYNFTTAATQAFSSNQREVSPGVWAMYSGDLAPQDEFIDILDQSVIDNDIFNFAGGYVVSDLNGDGFVDIVDQSIVDNNIFNFIGSIHP